MMNRYLLICFFILINCISNAQNKPNILIIISDDHSFQTIGAYGSAIAHTPNIDRIAKEGTIFDRAYVTNSLCGPSRATLLTGKYSHKNGFKDNENSHFDHNQSTFVKDLQASGYRTAWIGKQHLGAKPQGFDYYSILDGQGHYFNPVFINQGDKREQIEGYVSDIVTEKAEKWLDTLSKDKPFCLILGHKATHRSWLPDPKDFGTYDQAEIPLPDNFYDQYDKRKAAAVQEMSIAKDMLLPYDLKMYPTKEDMRKDYDFSRFTESQFEKYYAYYKPIQDDFYARKLSGRQLEEWKYRRYMIDYLNTAASLDRNIGEVLDYLDTHGLKDNTIVIYLSDQGFYMGEHGWFDKRFMYEESFRTPMVARYPGVIKPGTHTEARVMNIDIAPTLLEIAGVRIPKEIQGKSFYSVLKDARKSFRKSSYYHYYENGTHAVSPHFGVSDGKYKLIRFYKRVESWELYDLEKDPHEMNNIYADKSSDAIIGRMKKKLLAEIRQVDDKEAEAIFEQKL
ncbi:sulfatase [Sphingobacterium spiritivorum]|uniref:sulfatase family protein n=1 Tax=Sphingobacterium spiritivorum TaxID=258 RepID=UPI001919414C|nr:sulfatase [Sphingobacterium spiritivorum]QQT27891.1 sulfatase [Sphingobacterium spiritivorum]